jgi:hypothetical protein
MHLCFFLIDLLHLACLKFELCRNRLNALFTPHDDERRKKERKEESYGKQFHFFRYVGVCVYNFISYIDRLAHAMVFPYFCKRRNVVLHILKMLKLIIT